MCIIADQRLGTMFGLVTLYLFVYFPIPDSLQEAKLSPCFPPNPLMFHCVFLAPGQPRTPVLTGLVGSAPRLDNALAYLLEKNPLFIIKLPLFYTRTWTNLPHALIGSLSSHQTKFFVPRIKARQNTEASLHKSMFFCFWFPSELWGWIEYHWGLGGGRHSQGTDGGRGGQVYGEGKFMEKCVQLSVLLLPFSPLPASWRRTFW